MGFEQWADRGSQAAALPSGNSRIESVCHCFGIVNDTAHPYLVDPRIAPRLPLEIAIPTLSIPFFAYAWTRPLFVRNWHR